MKIPQHDHWTIAEFREYMATGRPPLRGGFPCSGPAAEEKKKAEKPKSKYKNRRTFSHNKWFDSAHEAQVYEELLLQVRAGELICVVCQVKFDLLEEEKLQYVADFVTFDPNMKAEVIDAKSEETRKNRVYINKKKMMKEKYGIVIVER